jgi:amidase
MPDFEEILWLDGTAQASLILSGEILTQELIEAAIRRIEERNPALNAIVTPMFEEARRTANSALEGPFAGVPYLLKDLGGVYNGVKLTSGSRLLKDFVSDHDSELVVRLKRAGLVILGKTNTPEFGLMPTTEPLLFGPCHNPWRDDVTCGGSSGGSAAAVAAGMTPMAHANDGGGSIRIPASCCGLFGLKPTRGRITHAPDRGASPGGFAGSHAVTRSVRDSAALLDATAGPAPGDPYFPPSPERPYREEVGADPGKLRIGFSRTVAGEDALHGDCIAAVEDAASLCADLGHEVEEAEPAFDRNGLMDAFTVVFIAGLSSGLDALAESDGLDFVLERIEPLTHALYDRAVTFTVSEYLTAEQTIHKQSREIAAFYEDYDIWLTPTLGEPPVPLGTFEFTPGSDPMETIHRALKFVPFTPICNATGQPAMSVPLFWNDEGLPIGAHFVAEYGNESLLFRLARQLEQSRPWDQRRPPE